MSTKICSTCHLELPLSSFSKNIHMKDGYQNVCKKCKKEYDRQWRLNTIDQRRSARFQTKYGITLEDYNQMFEEQHGCCAVCGRHQTELPRVLSVEHNHITKKVRSLTCDKCNTMIGFIENNSDLVDKIKLYLQEY